MRAQGPESLKLVFLDFEIDMLQVDIQETEAQAPCLDHASLGFLKVKIRRKKRRARQTRTSQTATGWEYFKPYHSKRS